MVAPISKGMSFKSRFSAKSVSAKLSFQCIYFPRALPVVEKHLPPKFSTTQRVFCSSNK